MPEFRYPNASHGTPEAQIVQIRSYLHQLVDTLNNSSLGAGGGLYQVDTGSIVQGGGSVIGGSTSEKTPQETFNSIKSLIINSADIIDAYYEEMDQRFSGSYVAQSEFGTFQEETQLAIRTNSQNVTENYQDIQTINGNLVTIGSSITSLDNAQQQTFTSIESINGSVGSLQSAQTATDGNIVMINQNVSSLQTAQSATDSTIITINQNVGNLQTAQGNTDTAITGINGSVSDLQTAQQETDKSIGTINGNVAGLQEGQRVTGEQIKSANGQIGDLQAAQGETNKQVGDLSNAVDNLYQIQLQTDAYIKRGLLGYAASGFPVYGIEVGQTNKINGVEVFEKFARFTSDRLSFYDNNGNEVAYFSDYRLHITEAEIVTTLYIGGYTVDTSDGILFRWGGD